MSESQHQSLARTVSCPSCGHRENRAGKLNQTTMKCSQCQASIPILEAPGVSSPQSRATRWSFLAPGIIALALLVLAIISIGISLLVATSGSDLFLAPFIVAILIHILPVFLLLSSGIPSLCAFLRKEPLKYWSLLLPILSIIWLLPLEFIDRNALSPWESAFGKADSITVGAKKNHFGPFGLEFNNDPFIKFQGKQVPLRWLSLPENMELWKGYDVKFYTPEERSVGRLLVVSPSDFNESECQELFDHLQEHRLKIADELKHLMAKKERVSWANVTPFREHIGIVYGEKRRYHSDPPGYLLEVTMDGTLRTETWAPAAYDSFAGSKGGGFPAQLVVQEGQLVLLLCNSSSNTKRDVGFFRNLIRSDHSPNNLPSDWNAPEAPRLRDFAEIREMGIKESLENYEWRLSTSGGQRRSLRFDPSGKAIVDGEDWGRWSIEEEEIVVLEPEASWPIRFDEKRSLVGRGRYGRVSLQRGDTLAYVKLTEERRRAANQASTGQQPNLPENPSNLPTYGEPYETRLKMKFVPVSPDHHTEKKILFAETEVTRGEFQRFLDETNYSFEKLGGGRPRTHPIIGVTWADANAFCEWLTEVQFLSGTLAPGQHYRLPTDHEWSRAAGIADREDPNLLPSKKTQKLQGIYVWGASWPPPNDAGNFSGEEASDIKRKGIIEGFEDGFRLTSPVRSFKPNTLGLYDLAGNVWEWCQDDYDGKGNQKTLRGGSYYQAKQLDASTRKASEPDRKIAHYGFRCVLDLEKREMTSE